MIRQPVKKNDELIITNYEILAPIIKLDFSFTPQGGFCQSAMRPYADVTILNKQRSDWLVFFIRCKIHVQNLS